MNKLELTLAKNWCFATFLQKSVSCEKLILTRLASSPEVDKRTKKWTKFQIIFPMFNIYRNHCQYATVREKIGVTSTVYGCTQF